jgi:hypothetical protein
MGASWRAVSSRWTKATPARARAKITALNSRYQEFSTSASYLRTIYKYRLTFFYGITISLYKSTQALGTVAPATVAEPTAVQQTALKFTQPVIFRALNPP